MPELQEKNAASIPDCLGDWLPCIDLLLCVYARSVWIPACASSTPSERNHDNTKKLSLFLFNRQESEKAMVDMTFQHAYPCPVTDTHVASDMRRPPLEVR